MAVELDHEGLPHSQKKQGRWDRKSFGNGKQPDNPCGTSLTQKRRPESRTEHSSEKIRKTLTGGRGWG